MAWPDFAEKCDIIELSTNSVLRQIVGSVAFIVPDVTDLTDEEAKIKIEIEKKYNLYLFSSVDAGDQDWSNFNVIILSTGLTLTDLDDLIYLEKPIITLDSSHPNGLLAMTTSAVTDSGDENQIDIQTIEQQIIAGAGIIATGYTTVYSASNTLDGITLAGVAGIINLAVKVGTAYSCLTVLEKGVSNASGNLSNDIRIFIGLVSADKLNSTGLDLLLQAILYAGCMASNVSHATYALLKKLQTIEYKVSSPSKFPLGDMHFVSASGVDTADGTSWAKATRTIRQCAILTTTQNNDYIFVGHGSFDEDDGVEGAYILNDDVHVIGQGTVRSGTSEVLNSHVAATHVFNISGANVEIAGFFIDEFANTVEGIYVTGANAWIHHNIIDGTMENGIHLDGADMATIEHNEIMRITNDAIELSGSATKNTINDNFIYGAGDYGIHLNGNIVDNNSVCGNIINGSAGTTDIGIRVVLGDNNTIVDNWIGGCATSPTFDSGSNNIWHNHIDKISGSFNILAADTTVLTDKVTDIDLPTGGRFVVQFDVATLVTNESGKTVTFYVYVKVDETNYQVADFKKFKAGTDTIHPKLEFESEGGNAKAKVASQMDSTSSGTRAVPYKIIPVGQ